MVYEVQLDDVLWLIIEETEEQIYKDTADFEMAKHNFETFFQKTQMWEIFSSIFLAWNFGSNIVSNFVLLHKINNA